MDAHSMGSAAAMQVSGSALKPPSSSLNLLQAFKMFSGGGGSSSSSGSASGGGKAQLISMAMAEASKLFDKSGGSASGGKQDVINGAVKTVMKLILQVWRQ